MRPKRHPHRRAVCVTALTVVGDTFSVREFGARGDGRSKDTVAFQRAIDTAAERGGGVVVEPGRYLCGTVHLRSHVRIRLLAGATVAESPDLADFDPYERLDYDPECDRETSDFAVALFAGRDIEDVTILGPGTVDGSRTQRGNRGDRPGPKPLAFKGCQNVTVRDLSVVNAPNYAVSLLGCRHVRVDGVTVRNGYSDGIDPDSCQDVQIANCNIECYDDAICLKASGALGKPVRCENIVVTNCILHSASNHFKLGTESRGGFRNIVLSNCVFVARQSGAKAGRDRGGIALTQVDGGTIEGVSIQNVVMRDLYSSIFIRLGDRGRHPVGAIRDISLCGISGGSFEVPVVLAGLEGHPIERVSLSGLNLATVGGAGAAAVLPTDQKRSEYPESNMFGVPPAQALFARHVRGLQLSASRFRAGAADGRPYLALDDVRGGAFRDVEFGSPAPVAVLARRLSDFTFDDLAMPKGVASVRWQEERGRGVRFGAVARRTSTSR
jgi:polygalacturonase